MNSLLLLNPRSGKGQDESELRRLLSAADQLPDVRVHLIGPGDDVTRIAADAVDQGILRVAAAGGDGTISAVASALVHTRAELVPVPFGTKNHFCSDLGVHQDPVEALQGLLAPPQALLRNIDVGCVNGRHFLNNSSLGLYPHLVKRRLRRHNRIGRWPAYALAALEMARHPIHLTVEIPVEAEGEPIRVGLVFVSNNVMDAGWPDFGRRRRLDEGVLQLFVLKNGSVWPVLRAAASFLSGRTKRSPVLSEHRVRELTVRVHHSSHRQVRVSCDGEVYSAQPPIHYSVLPGALRLRLILQPPPTGSNTSPLRPSRR